MRAPTIQQLMVEVENDVLTEEGAQALLSILRTIDAGKDPRTVRVDESGIVRKWQEVGR